MIPGYSIKVIQPLHWCGTQKGDPDSSMVCGACPDWKVCAAAGRCARARDEDYARSPTNILVARRSGADAEI